MEVAITTEFIKLDQLLKYAGVAESGADAKELILAGCVRVDGSLCTMRGKKLRPGNRVLITDGETTEIMVTQ